MNFETLVSSPWKQAKHCLFHWSPWSWPSCTFGLFPKILFPMASLFLVSQNFCRCLWNQAYFPNLAESLLLSVKVILFHLFDVARLLKKKLNYLICQILCYWSSLPFLLRDRNHMETLNPSYIHFLFIMIKRLDYFVLSLSACYHQ